MKKLTISNEHRALIESVIRENPRFKGNEELIDLFCASIYKKSYLLIDAIRDMSRLRRHLLMICDSCMDSVIKEKKKFDATRIYKRIIQEANKNSNVVSVKTKSVLYDQDEQNEFNLNDNERGIVNLKEEIQKSDRYGATDNLIDPKDFCNQKRVSETTVEKLINLVLEIDKKFPKKKYYEIFKLRYIKRYNQLQIARSMQIPQIELSKRFVEMVKLTNEMT